MMRTLALAFGVTKATDLAREVFERTTGLTPRPYLKSVLATALAGAAGCTYEQGWRARLEMAAGIAGVAALLHEAQAVLSTAADKNKVMVVERSARAATSSMSASAPGRRVQPI